MTDFDGITEAFSGSRKEELISIGGGNCTPVEGITCDHSLDIDRLVEESASVKIDKEDYMVHAALVHKFGAPAPASHKPMK